MMNKDGMDILIFCEIGNDPQTLKKAGQRIVDGKVFYFPYLDPKKIPTIGIGTISYPNGKLVTMSDPEITEDQALEYLNYELKEKAATLENWAIKTGKKRTLNQFSALLCFSYNEGCGPIITPGGTLNKALLGGNEQEIRNAFALYNKITVKFLGIPYKKVLNGLTIRRKMEADLYFKV